MRSVTSDEEVSAGRDTVTRVVGFASRLRSWATGAGIRVKILGIVVSLTLILGLGITFQVRSVTSSALIDELHKRVASLAGDLAGRAFDSASAGDLEGVRSLLEQVLAQNPEAVFAYMTGPDGAVLEYASASGNFPASLGASGPAATEYGLLHSHPSMSDAPVHQFEASIPGGFGAISVGFGETRVSEVVAGMTTQMAALTLLVALVGVAAAGLLTVILTRPILELVETTRKVGRGDLSARAHYAASDEFGSLSRSFNEMVDELEKSKEAIDSNERARTRLIDNLISAQEDERRRLARGLHDTVGQSLSSLSVGIALLAKLDDGSLAAKCEELQVLSAEVMTQIRAMSRELRPSVLDDLGLGAALERFAAHHAVRFPGTQVGVHVELADRLPPATETTLYRIIQEALTNATRHGRGHSLDVLVVEKQGSVRAIVEDDGHGFDVESARRQGNSVGLHAMSERAELLNGTLQIESSPRGTTVLVEIPL